MGSPRSAGSRVVALAVLAAAVFAGVLAGAAGAGAATVRTIVTLTGGALGR